LLVLVFYAGVTYRLWVVSDQANRLNGESARLDQRAWVGPGKASFLQPVEPDKEFSLCVEIVNSGKTPALRFKGKISIQMQPIESLFLPDYRRDPLKKSKASVGTLLPGVPRCLHSPPTQLSSEVIDTLKSGEETFYVFGRVEYGDVFGGIHCTMFCYSLTRKLDDFGLCPTYNDLTDAKCED
jgi:hypothetical protein